MNKDETTNKSSMQTPRDVRLLPHLPFRWEDVRAPLNSLTGNDLQEGGDYLVGGGMKTGRQDRLTWKEH